MTTKQKVLQELLSANSNSSKNPDSEGFVSGQNLAEKCSVSRTAIWKAINSLEKEGYEIQAITNKGYKLSQSNSVISEYILNSLLPENSSITYEVHSVLDSSNAECKRQCTQVGSLHALNSELSEQGKKLHQHVVVAETQTAGRGRLGRNFYSPSQTGVYFSMIYIPKSNIIQPAKMTATAAVAVCHAIKNVYGLDAKIKWVNDLFVNGKKVCGILTEGIANFETAQIEAAIIGIGINILKDSETFPDEINKTAGSLLENSSENSKNTKRNELISQITTELSKLYELQENQPESPETKSIMAEYRDLTFLIGKKLEISPVINGNEKYFATAIDITDEANLVVQKEDGTIVTLQSGEVSLSSSQFAN